MRKHRMRQKLMCCHLMQVHRLSAMELDLEAQPTQRTAPTVVRYLAWTGTTWLLLVVLCGALFLDGLDISMVGVALPSIGSDLHMSPDSLQWIVSAYVLG